jgi:hypothetical protein
MEAIRSMLGQKKVKALGIRRINHISASSAMHIIPLKLSLAPVLDGIW